jgi:hypothetical protein
MSQENSVLKNGARLIGETFISPGTSLLCDGQIKSGLLHAGAGLVARFTLGMPGLLLVAADSYSKTVTGKSLWQHCVSDGSKTVESSEKEADGDRVAVAAEQEQASEEPAASQKATRSAKKSSNS